MNAGEGGYDWSVVETVVSRTAACQGTDPGTLDPLAESVDPGLVAAFANSSAVLPDSTLRFAYHDCVVTIGGAGEVSVEASN